MYKLYVLVESDYYSNYCLEPLDSSNNLEKLKKIKKYIKKTSGQPIVDRTYIGGFCILKVNNNEDVFFQDYGMGISNITAMSKEEQENFKIKEDYEDSNNDDDVYFKSLNKTSNVLLDYLVNFAIKNDNIKLIKFLKNKKKFIFTCDELELALEKKSLSIFEYLIKYGNIDFNEEELKKDEFLKFLEKK
jgi:hypothetical protein